MGKSPVKCPVGEMKQRPQNKYNGQTKESTLTTDTMEEYTTIRSDEIEEKATN